MSSNTVRLNEFNRGIIKERILVHAFAKREEAMAAEIKRVGQLVYNDVYPVDVRKKMAALPAAFLPTANRVEVQLAGDRSTTTVHFGEYLPVSAACANYGTMKIYGASDHRAVEIRALHAAVDRLASEKREKKSEINRVLLSVQTIAGLVKVWPSIEHFVADFKPTTPDGGALAKVMRSLDESLGLPPIAAKSAPAPVHAKKTKVSR